MTNDNLSGLEYALAPPIAATRLFAVAYCRATEEGHGGPLLLLRSSWNLRRWHLPATTAASPVYCENVDSLWILGDVLTAAWRAIVLSTFAALRVPRRALFFFLFLRYRFAFLYSPPCANYFRNYNRARFSRLIVKLPFLTKCFKRSQRSVLKFFLLQHLGKKYKMLHMLKIIFILK